MANQFFLLNFSTSGIKCLEKEVQMDFYGKVINKDFDPQQYRIKGVYGENGAGKSALITAVSLFKDIITRINYLEDSATQQLLHELINKRTNCYRFACEFVSKFKGEGLIIYKYELELKEANGVYVISKDSLHKRINNSNNKEWCCYSTENGVLTEINATKESDRETLRFSTMNLLSKRPLPQLLLEADLSDSFDYTDVANLFVFAYSLKVQIDKKDRHEQYFRMKQLKKVLGESARVEETLRDAISISLASEVNERLVHQSVFERYKRNVAKLEKFIRLFKKELKSIDIDASIDGEYYSCKLIFNYGDYKVDKEFESTGIRKLVEIFDSLIALDSGNIVFIDEMDSNINNIYLCAMLEYFISYSTGQLCFTSHSIDPMTAIKDEKKSIDFLTNDGEIIPWIKNGNASPESSYRNGMIKGMPFNIDSTDFIGVFGEA